MHVRKPSLMALGACLLASPALAADDVQDAYALSMGGIAAADPRSNTALAVNPGVIGILPRYDLGAFAGTRQGGFEAGGGVVDSRSSPVALGLGYRYLTFEPPLTDDDQPGWVEVGTTPSNQKRSHDIVAGIAVPFWENRASIGLGGSFSFTNDDRRDTAYEGDLDFGGAAQPVEWLTIGLAGQNLLPIGGGYPASIVAGVTASEESLGLIGFEIEPRFDGRVAFRAGGNKLLGPVEIRAGWHLEADKAHGVTGGISYKNEQGGLDYGIEVPIGSKLTFGAIIHRIGIRIFA